MEKNIIVGFDPGLTVGIAILDVNGNLIDLTSKKSVGKQDVIKYISRFGRPIIIATDKKPIPKSINFLASSFQCIVYGPKKEVSSKKKQEIVRSFFIKPSDMHQSDALFAAIKAWKFYRHKFDRIRNFLSKIGMEYEFEKLLPKLIKGKLEIKKERLVKKTIKPNLKSLKEEVEIKNGIITDLSFENKLLTDIVVKLKKELNYYKKLKFNFDELVGIKSKIKKMERTLSLMKSIERILLNGYLPILTVEKISIETLEELNTTIGLKGRIVYSNDKNNFNLLNPYEIDCLITKDEISNDFNFPVIKWNKNVKNIDDMLAIKKEIIEREIQKFRKVRLVKWIEKYQRKRK